MGSRPDDIAREIRLLRGDMSGRIESIRGRVRDEAREWTESVPSGFSIEDLMAEHPLTTLLGAFGLGIALGAVSETAQDAAAGAIGTTARGASSVSSRGAGLLDGLIAGASGMVSDTVRQELERMVREVLGSGRRPAPEPREDGTEAAESRHYDVRSTTHRTPEAAAVREPHHNGAA